MAQRVREGDLVTLQFHAHDLSGRMITDCFVETFIVGQGQVMPALELACVDVAKGEKNTFRARPRDLRFSHPGLRGVMPNQPVNLHVEVLDVQASAMGKSTTCAFITEQEVAALFERWNESLKTKDPRKVTENYSKSAVLLPTVSDKPRTDHGAIEDYFTHFLAKSPVGKIDERSIKIGCDTVQDMGLYTFQFEDGRTVQARYSFIYEFENGHWVISHHHSSMMPEQFVGH
jgi:uncharacterized protein (TIGR02246 family)